MNRESNSFDADVLGNHIANAKQYIHTISKQFLENKINFDCEFSDETKEGLKEKMKECLSFDNQLKLYEQVGTKLQYEAHDFVQNTQLDQNIEELMNLANFEDKFEAILAGAQSTNGYDPNEDQQYKNLEKILTEQSETSGNDDVEMMETEFVIPLDPISRKEIDIPVRNKKCNHLYDKDNFLKVFQSNDQSSIKCPFTGCTNKHVSISDVEEDSVMKIKIDRARLDRDNE